MRMVPTISMMDWLMIQSRSHGPQACTERPKARCSCFLDVGGDAGIAMVSRIRGAKMMSCRLRRWNALGQIAKCRRPHAIAGGPAARGIRKTCRRKSGDSGRGIIFGSGVLGGRRSVFGDRCPRMLRGGGCAVPGAEAREFGGFGLPMGGLPAAQAAKRNKQNKEIANIS